jgi:hypothetical protein
MACGGIFRFDGLEELVVGVTFFSSSMPVEKGDVSG